MEKQEATGSDLYLDTSELLNDGSRQKESVTDKYGVHVFSDDYQECIRIVQQEREIQSKETYSRVFVTDISGETESSISENLFQEVHASFNEENIVKEHTRAMWYGIIICTVLVTTWIAIYLQNGKKEKHAGHNTKNR